MKAQRGSRRDRLRDTPEIAKAPCSSVRKLAAREGPSGLTGLDREAIGESVIQRFETCYDTLWKTLKRYLTEEIRGTARTYSDLDLIVFTTPEKRQLVSELKDALGESTQPFIVDLHVWDELPEQFHHIYSGEPRRASGGSLLG
jgi:hypothetical protein